jgi:hypothetical protein
MKLGIGIGFLEGFRCGRHFISPLELQGGKTVGTLLNQVDFLFVVGAPEIELPVQSLIEVRFAPLSDDVRADASN